MRHERALGRRLHDNLAAAHPFADVVVRFAFENEAQSVREEDAETLARAALELQFERAIGQALLAVLVADLAADFCAEAAVHVAHFEAERDGLFVGDGVLRVLEHAVVERVFGRAVVALPGAEARRVGVVGRGREQAREVEGVGLRMIGDVALPEEFGAADDVVEFADAEAGEDFAHFLGDAVEEVHEHLGRAFEFGAELFVLRGDADGAGVQMALAHIDAAGGDERGGAEVELLGAEDRGHDDVDAGAHSAVGAEDDAAAQVVEDERLLGFGDAEFPRAAGVFDRGKRRRAGAAVVTGDEHDVGVRFGHTGGDGADAGFADELHADFRARVHFLQVVDELRQILDGVDVVVRRRRDEHDAGRGVPEPRDDGADFVAGKLAAFAGLRALRHLDFDLLRAREIRGGDAEATAGDLLDRAVREVAVWAALEALGILAAFAAVRLSADAVHGDGERLVRLGTERAERHAGGGEAHADVFDRLYFIERDRLGGGHEFHHVLDGNGLLRLHLGDVFLVLVGVAALHEFVERLDDRRRDGVALADAAEAVVAGIVERELLLGG